jgi:ribosome biogenesis GTPase A
MNKWSALKDMIHGADVIVEVVDSRDVAGTRLPVAEKWAGSKRLLVVANKTDLLPEGAEMPKLQNKGIYASAKSTDEDERWRVIRAIMERTHARPVRAILVGYPNVGKSSLINMLARRKATRVSAVAGTTKNIQWVKVNQELMVSDYRGLFPAKEPQEALVRKGALNVQGDEEKHAYAFAGKVLAAPALKRWLEKKYDISLADAKDAEAVLERIARRRGWFLKGGEPNLQEACRSLVRAMAEAPEI